MGFDSGIAGIGLKNPIGSGVASGHTQFYSSQFRGRILSDCENNARKNWAFSRFMTKYSLEFSPDIS